MKEREAITLENRTNYEKMLAEEEYIPDQELGELAYECSKGLIKINSLPPRDPERQAFLKTFFASLGEHVTIKGNFNCDYGRHISIGDGAIINCSVTILDTNYVTIGKDVFIAPGVVISAATHPLDAERRVRRHFQSHPITIRDRAWIGANATILTGVTIGHNSVIAAGSVVTEDIPDNCLAAGAPAKVIRVLPESPEEEGSASAFGAGFGL